MNRIIHRLEIILIGLLTSTVFISCSNSFTYFLSNPPRLKLKPEQRDILFISAFDTTRFGQEFNQDKKITVYNESYLKYVNSVLKGFDNVATGIEWQDYKADHFPSKDEIQALCRKYNKDMVMILSDFSMEREQEMEVTEDEDGDKDRTAFFYVVVEIEMRLYDKFGELIDREVVQEKELLSERSVISGLFSVGPALGNRGKQIYPLMSGLGVRYTNNFKNTREKIDAQYYASGELKPIQQLIERGELEQAISLSIDVYQKSSDANVKRKASHNLHHLFMAVGNEEESWNWDTLDY